MRTIWNGSISFGLVSIPVGLALATKPAARQSDVSFRLLHRDCRTPIKQKRWCTTHDREVGPDELVKGWEVAKGEFVIVEDADLEAIERTDDSRSIDIMRFVPLEEVDPIFFDRTYFLAPSDAGAQRRPYVLLLRAMQETGMAAVGKFVLWGKENLCLLRPLGTSLALQTLFYSEDIRSRGDIDDAVGGVEVKAPELDLAKQVIQSLVGEWEPHEFENEYRGELRAMLEAKLSGEEIAVPEPVAEAPVVDLMEALRRSVDEAKERKASSPDGKARKSPARSRAKAKSA
jgi:DNA end-binding protein Ku